MNNPDDLNQKYAVTSYENQWVDLFISEARLLAIIFGVEALAIEHIGSTAVPNLSSKPIIDVAVLIALREKADKYIEPLASIGYVYDQPASSPERHFFRKYGSIKYHLSIAYRDKGSYWERQILFRDYLRKHEKAKKEYESLKLKLINEDPTGRHGYIQGKNEFIQRIL